MAESNPIKPLRDWILQLPDVTEASHRMGGTEFKVHGIEFMHSHGPRHLDILLSKEDQEAALKDGKAERHRAEYHHKAGWVTHRIGSENDAESAKEVIKLAYNNAKQLAQ